ncbi:MipA/OmpV family protein [Thiohalorhabdus denitrificans]|uniref:Outer membrane protein n=1 Tax=Thiohalorhabdus denitrificans TaxID=381306 RepID=A0A1G5FN25_9GAMM|nr:MipA/OmpV family protein [Thiohalorhabdus denitrificans]SCY40685.1 outer membrane protein [Thiohalorhabdus denitrificans]
MKRRIGPITLLALAAPALCAAQGPPGQPPVMVGMGVVASPSPYAGVSSNLTPVPVVNLDLGRFKLRGIQAQYRLWGDRDFRLEAVARPRFQSFRAEDSPALAGMETRRRTAEAGLQLTRRLGPWRLRAQGVTDLLGRHDGQEVSVEVTYRLGGRRLSVSPGAGMEWASGPFVDYYYGVRPEEARAGRPAYTGTAAWNPYVALVGRARLTGRWGLFAYLRHSWLDDAITDSPIVDRSTSYSGILAISYAFGGGQQRGK